MNSFNHYAYGAIGDWMYRVSAGIETMGPGYRHVIIQPHPTKKLTFSRASFESSYGTIASGWERKEGKIIFKIRIPANTSATIILPAASQDKVLESGKPLSQNVYLKDIKVADNKLTILAGSGEYTFEIVE
jgi:alpha-L-rhamnosidase